MSTTSQSGDEPDPYGDWYEQDPYGEGPVEDEPEPEQYPDPIFVCQTPGCMWTGDNALAHHRIAHHPIAIRNAPRLGACSFSCCVREKQQAG